MDHLEACKEHSIDEMVVVSPMDPRNGHQVVIDTQDEEQNKAQQVTPDVHSLIGQHTQTVTIEITSTFVSHFPGYI